MPKQRTSQFEFRMRALIMKVNNGEVDFPTFAHEILALQKSYYYNSSYPKENIGIHFKDNPYLALEVFLSTYKSLPAKDKAFIRKRVGECVGAEAL